MTSLSPNRGPVACGLALACFLPLALASDTNQGPPEVMAPAESDVHGSDPASAELAALPELDPETRHLAGVRAERVADFFLHWDAATDERRDLVRGLFRDLKSPGAPAEVLPSLGAIDVATRVLQGEEPDALIGEHPAGVLAVQAMSLDLRVTPGVYRLPEPGGRAPSLVVDVVPLYELRDAMDVDVTLYWSSPARSETVARSEPVAASSFQGDGFQMFVRAPKEGQSEGLSLVAELQPRSEDGRLLRAARSRPTRVGQVEEDPLEVLATADPRFRSALLDHGLRVAPGFRSLPSAWLEPSVLDRTGASPLKRLAFSPVPDDEQPLAARPIVILTEPRARAGGAPFAGPVGRAWSRSLTGAYTATYPLGAGEAPRVSTAIRRAKADGDREVTLVLFGDAVLASQLEFLRHGLPDVDRLVVVANAWRPAPTLPTVPTLYLTPDAAAADVAGRAEHVTTELLDDTVFLSGPSIPGRVAAWLETLRADEDAPR